MMSEAKAEGAIPGPSAFKQAADFRSVTWWAGSWKALLAKGIFAISLGILAWVWPGITVAVIVIMFGVFLWVDGIFTIMMSSTHRKDNKNWKWSLAAGIFGTVLGSLILFWPLATGFILVIFLATWIMVMGISNIIMAVRMRKEIPMGWPLTAGIFAVIFSILMFASPLAGVVALLWIWATFGIVFGTLMCIQAYSGRRMLKKAQAKS